MKRRPGRKPKTTGERVRGFLKGALILGVAGLLLGTLVFFVLYKAISIPEPNEAFKAQTTFAYYSGGKQELGTYYDDQNRESIPLKEMPQNIQDAVVAAENKTFWSDRGIDPVGILRAGFNNASGGSTQGASTITQQYVKLLYLTSERSYTRKIKEAIVSLKIHGDMSKPEILEGYLNTIYFGRGAYGIQAASEAFFGHDAKELSLRESAALAAILNNPTRFSPDGGKEAREELKGRYAYVLNNMAEMGTISAQQEEKAVKRLPKFPKLPQQSQFGGQRGHMLALVKKELLATGKFTEDQIDGGGLRITTTFTAEAMKAVEEGVLANRPTGFPGEKALHVGAATVEVGTGALRGFYGGQDYLESQINWAVAGGMAGSTMKAATDVAAIRDGFSLNDTFEGNSPIDIGGTEFENQGDQDYGSAVSMITATENSINTAFVDMVDSMSDGPQKVITAAQDLGIPGNKAGKWGIPNKSTDFQDNIGVTLGTAQVSPINMANAYATLANGGIRSDIHVVEQVKDRNGEVLYSWKDRSKRTVEEDITSDVSYALQQVVQSGSGTEALALGRPAAGKTGTATNDDGDVSSSWFVGYTPQMSTAVMYVRGRGREQLDGNWLPYSSDGKAGYFGGNYPAKTWTSIMQTVMEGRDIEEFPEPAYVDGDAPDDGHEPYVPPATSTATQTSKPKPPRGKPSIGQPTKEPTTQSPTQEPTTATPTPTETVPPPPPTTPTLPLPTETTPPPPSSTTPAPRRTQRR